MKHTYTLFIMMALILCSCHSNKKQETANTEPSAPKDTTIISGVYHFKFDNIEMWTLQDKQQTMSAKLFAGANQKIVKEFIPSGEAEAAVNTFLVKKDNQYILFDTGLGLDEGGAMLDQLIMLGIPAEDISAVCITHFHGDHIGGMLTNGKASFPNAKVYFSKREQNAFRNDSNVQKMLKEYSGRTHAFKDGEIILGGIITKPAPGHTPGHTMYQVGNVLIIGDLLHAASLQIPHPEISAKYDQDKTLAVATRLEGYQFIENNHLIVAGMHLPYSGVMQNFPKK